MVVFFKPLCPYLLLVLDEKFIVCVFDESVNADRILHSI